MLDPFFNKDIRKIVLMILYPAPSLHRQITRILHEHNVMASAVSQPLDRYSMQARVISR